MKRRICLVLSAVGLLVLPAILNRANPIVEWLFNELVFDSGRWRFEIHAPQIQNLDGWYITSRSGQAYFKNGIQLGSAYRVITPESLLSALTINPLGDSLTFHSPQSHRSWLYFGPGEMVAAPRIGQSLSLREFGTQFYYLDNTPTLGQPNDALNAFGTVQGHVSDSLGLPISGVMVSWGEMSHAYSDSAGNFSVTEYARRLSLNFTHSIFATRYVTVQVWPETTVVIGVTMDRIVDVQEGHSTSPPAFRLHVNYPNPFNPSTLIDYELAVRIWVTLKVYDVSGRQVAVLVDDLQERGYKTVKFDATHFASGVYFCRMEAGRFVDSKKLLLLK